jgi:hypothetical protein
MYFTVHVVFVRRRVSSTLFFKQTSTLSFRLRPDGYRQAVKVINSLRHMREVAEQIQFVTPISVTKTNEPPPPPPQYPFLIIHKECSSGLSSWRGLWQTTAETDDILTLCAVHVFVMFLLILCYSFAFLPCAVPFCYRLVLLPCRIFFQCFL